MTPTPLVPTRSQTKSDTRISARCPLGTEAISWCSCPAERQTSMARTPGASLSEQTTRTRWSAATTLTAFTAALAWTISPETAATTTLRVDEGLMSTTMAHQQNYLVKRTMATT